MNKFFEDYLTNLKELHDDVRSAIDGLPGSALDWSPSPDFNSIGVLVVHIAGAERYWISDVVAETDSNRDRESEFSAHGLEPEELAVKLSESWAFVQSVLAGLTQVDLDSIRISPRDGREITVSWALGHVLKHTALHVGHLQVTRQLWQSQMGS